MTGKNNIRRRLSLEYYGITEQHLLLVKEMVKRGQLKIDYFDSFDVTFTIAYKDIYLTDEILFLVDAFTYLIAQAKIDENTYNFGSVLSPCDLGYKDEKGLMSWICEEPYSRYKEIRRSLDLKIQTYVPDNLIREIQPLRHGMYVTRNCILNHSEMLLNSYISSNFSFFIQESLLTREATSESHRIGISMTSTNSRVTFIGEQLNANSIHEANSYLYLETEIFHPNLLSLAGFFITHSPLMNISVDNIDSTTPTGQRFSYSDLIDYKGICTIYIPTATSRQFQQASSQQQQVYRNLLLNQPRLIYKEGLFFSIQPNYMGRWQKKWNGVTRHAYGTKTTISQSTVHYVSPELSMVISPKAGMGKYTNPNTPTELLSKLKSTITESTPRDKLANIIRGAFGIEEDNLLYELGYYAYEVEEQADLNDSTLSRYYTYSDMKGACKIWFGSTEIIKERVE